MGFCITLRDSDEAVVRDMPDPFGGVFDASGTSTTSSRRLARRWPQSTRTPRQCWRAGTWRGSPRRLTHY